MTYLAAATLIDSLGRKAAPSVNPETDMGSATLAASRSGGLVSWLRRTAIARALMTRKAERNLNVAVKRLADLSPHLLADIGMSDTGAPLEMPPTALPRTAPAPVALRAAQRPAIQIPQRAPARSITKPPVRAARKEQRVAQ